MAGAIHHPQRQDSLTTKESFFGVICYVTNIPGGINLLQRKLLSMLIIFSCCLPIKLYCFALEEGAIRIFK